MPTGKSTRTAAADVVELRFPARADNIVLARLTAAAVAARAGFGVEDIEDLRLAVEELCLCLVPADGAGQLSLTFTRGDDLIEISAATDGSGTGHRLPEVDRNADLSARILDALVDEHGETGDGGRSRLWLRKRRNPVLA